MSQSINVQLDPETPTVWITDGAATVTLHGSDEIRETRDRLHHMLLTLADRGSPPVASDPGDPGPKGPRWSC